MLYRLNYSHKHCAVNNQIGFMNINILQEGIHVKAKVVLIVRAMNYSQNRKWTKVSRVGLVGKYK